MSEAPAKRLPPPDPNLVFRDVIETARTVYAGMRVGHEGEIRCSKALLDSQEPTPSTHRDGALGRFKEWAAKFGFEVTLSEQGSTDRKQDPGAFQAPKPITAEIVTLKIKRLK